MKKIIVWTMALVFSMCVTFAFAAEEKKAAPPEQKVEEKAAPEKKEAKKVSKEIALNLLTYNTPIDVIAKSTGLSIEEIKKLEQ